MRIADQALKSAFGKAVRNRRLASGISQEKLAELADIHRTYVGDVERGLRNIAIINMFRIAEALNTPLTSLVGDMEMLVQGEK
jgi:transcriptional regulator with XRE-family HTH domain